MFSFKEIEPFLGTGYRIIGNKNLIAFDKVLPINQADEFSLSWLKPSVDNSEEIIEASKSKIILCAQEKHFPLIDNKVLIQVHNPRLVYLRIVKGLFVQKTVYGIHPSAIISKDAVISDKVYIGPNTVIEKCIIGENVIIHGNCFLFDKVTIGNNVTIMPNTTIGGVGFGYERNEAGEFELFPHLGGVIIEDDVDIGANTAIDRGTLANTIIGSGTKIDNLVHISHNVNIGKNCAIIAHAMIGGSTIIGDDSWVAPTTSIRDGLNIGKNTVVGLGAVVLKNIPDNEVWFGNPAAFKVKK